MIEQELRALDLLAQAWNTFIELPVLHHADREEFGRAIHAAQNIILAREGLRTTDVMRLKTDDRAIIDIALHEASDLSEIIKRMKDEIHRKATQPDPRNSRRERGE